MKSRHDRQLNLPPAELRASERTAAPFRKSEQADNALGKSEQLAAELLDAAFELARLDNKEIAHLCGVSQSLVEKWRSPDQRGCPSFIQMLALPASFHIALHKVMNRRFGFGRAALARLMGDIEDLALVVD